MSAKGTSTRPTSARSNDLVATAFTAHLARSGEAPVNWAMRAADSRRSPAYSPTWLMTGGHSNDKMSSSDQVSAAEVGSDGKASLVYSRQTALRSLSG
eukprot:CAMPEP_0198602572 /NCGR_PEP_ID=MMETSP1462-20131121/150881_1 /TAXON_ID=1333877 /ORGANISM="Brandtodinium nutriculum, Strain RCC3387" /LENGTH=97 /DNA_ID=CAMNT_0044334335 /DNA_START=293 /DNA_END=582 /DNA_ORIENTATION=-